MNESRLTSITTCLLLMMNVAFAQSGSNDIFTAARSARENAKLVQAPLLSLERLTQLVKQDQIWIHM